MKKIILLICSIIMCALTSFSQDFGTQIPNSDFEADWKKYSGNNTSGSEPYCWHSFHSAKGSKAGLAEADHLAKDENVRPGSKGKYSIRVYPKEINLLVKKIIANGSLTNGRMNAGSTSADDNANHIYTDRGTEEFNTPIDVVPDSITVWLSFYSSGSGNQAAFHAAVHGDSNFILYGNGKESASDEQVADANYEFTRTTESSSELGWQRMSIPFDPKGTCTTPKYVLVTMSTNKTPAKGNSSDKLYVDDIVLIYNPTLVTGTLDKTLYEGEATESIDIQVPFTLTGSMSVSNLNKAANQVIAQLSDANGNFNNPIELGRITTNTSGVVDAKIPASVGDGNYKVRVVSTNYPMTAEPSSSQITVKRYYQVAFDAYDATQVTLSGDGKYYVSEDLNVTVSATMLTNELKFAYWMENESVVSLEPTYSFTIDKSHTFSAVAKKQYSVSIIANEGGTVSTEGGYFLENEGCNVVATPNDGYSFCNWTVGEEVVSTNSSYTFLVDSDKELVANFKKSIIISAGVNLAGAGAVSGAGEFVVDNDSVSVTLVAVSNDEATYQFLYWKEADSIVCNSTTYTFKTVENRQLTACFVTRVLIEATVPSDGGAITGAGFYNSGSVASLLAFPDDNYRFVGWFESDTLYSENTMIEISTDADRSFEARFAKQCSVVVETNPNVAADVQGTGVYDLGKELVLNALEKIGYVFKNWSIQDLIVSNEMTYSLVVDSSFTIVANYEKVPSYNINVEIDPLVGGSVNGAGSYFEQNRVELIAVPNNGYEFVNWTENGVEVSTETSISFTAQEDRSLVAHFVANFVGKTVELLVEEGGTVSGMGLYQENSEVTIVATPAEKYSFLSWTNKDGEVVSTSATYTFTITSDEVLQANFERYYSKYQITVLSANDEAGIVEGGKKYTEEDDVVVKAVPNEGYRFLHWLEDDEIVSTDAEYTFVCASKRTLTAVFMKVYVVTVADFEGGLIKGLGNGIFDENTQVTLAVTVDENHRFVSWIQAEDSTELANTVVYTFVVDADKSLSVVLKEKAKLCNVSVQTGGTVSGLRNGQYEAGETVTLIATPSEGYVFNGWVSNGVVISTETLLTFEVSDNIDIYAEFVPKAKAVSVDVSVNDETFGIVLGAGSYTAGDEITLFATPALGYEFVGWKKNGNMLSNLTTLYVTVVDDCTIEAEFRFIEKEIEITAVDEIAIECDVYPNPVSSTLNVVADREISSVKILTSSGIVVYNGEENAQQYVVDVTSLKAGVYFVIIAINGERIQKQIVVRR